ncbi:TolC family protein [uncultured Algimonas sp.]|uniref:TolC family protein n=1 Tax=uncultured Algimonas sp. TaxID=1547920 RepID=UPI00344B7B4A
MDRTAIRRDAGEASDLDVERARARLAAYDALRPLYDGEVRRAVLQLAVLSGRGAESAASIAERSGDLPTVPDRFAIESVAAALATRADIRAAEADYVVAARRVDLAALADRPVFSLFGAAGVESVSLDDLLDPESLVGAIGALADWTLLDGGANEAELDAQTARLRQAGAAYRSAVRDALLDAERAAVDLLAARERTDTQIALIQRRARVADMERRRFDAGEGTLLRIDEARLEVAEARLNLMEARTDQALEFIAIIKAAAPASLIPKA